MVRNDVQELLKKICIIFKNELGDNLVGIYLHGSLATNSFIWENSDVDFLVVVEHSVTQLEKIGIIQSLYALLPESPSKGMEMSIVLKSCLKPLDYPVPYELHFSNMHLQAIHDNIKKYCDNMWGKDEDLTAHIMVIWHRGIALHGPPIKQLFEEPSTSDYMRSIWFDIQDSEDRFLEQPVDTILNISRTLAYLEENIILSKKEAGEWIIATYGPNYQDLLAQVLLVYEGQQAQETINLCLAKKFLTEQLKNVRNKMQ